jgi:DNA-binding transcriptional LysR family regulator
MNIFNDIEGNGMNLRFVEAFYLAASFKSITRASEKLFLTQSAVSSRITALEEELGVLLLDRREKQFRLTIAGTRFLTYAERLLNMQRELKREMGSGTTTPLALRLGAIESVLHTWLIPLVEAMRHRYPELELELTVETTPVITEQVRRGSLDVGFAALPTQASGVRTRTLPSIDMVFVAPRELQIKRAPTLADIAQHEILTFQRGSQPHLALLDMFKTARSEVKKLHSVSSISAMVKLLEGGFGIATLPRAAAQQLMASHPFKLVECNKSLAPLPLYASWRVDPSSQSMEEVIHGALDFVAARSDSAPPLPRSAAKASKKKSMK